jgi:hypothetical protein
MKISASKVRVHRRYIVDCDVCEEAVVIEGMDGPYGYPTRQDAVAAKKLHLEQHAAGEL